MSSAEDLAVSAGGRARNARDGRDPLAVKAPSTYAFPENYGNPKNKIYQLSAGANDGVRLKALDGTVIFEGKGPEAAAKAADLVQQMGKQYGPQATWVLDKQPEGGNWQQVSQDTVGKKKTTALNAFLNVAAPIAGSFIPGLGPLLGLGAAGGAAAGAALGSVANSALQNKNSAQALKDAAISAGTAFVGSKLTGALGSKLGANTSLAPDLGSVGDLSGGFGAGQATGLTAGKVIADTPVLAAMQAAGAPIEEIVVTASKLGLSTAQKAALGLAGGAGVAAIANGAGASSAGGAQAEFAPNGQPIDTITVTAPKNVVPTDLSKLAVAGGTLGAGVAAIPDLSGVTNPDFNPDLNTNSGPMDKLKDWVVKNPLEAASLGLTALGGLGAATGAASGAGGYANTAGAGTRASLSPSFSASLPPPDPRIANRTPVALNLTQDQWNTYATRPEQSFFEVTPPMRQMPVADQGARFYQPIPSGAAPNIVGMAHGGYAVKGAGTGRSDSIPAVLSDGEYVVDAETVALLGDGSNKAGAKKLDELRVNIRRHKGASLAKGRFSVDAKTPEQYLSGGPA